MERSGGDSNFSPLKRGKHPSARWHLFFIIIFLFCRRFRLWRDGDLRLKQESRQIFPSRISSVSFLLSPNSQQASEHVCCFSSIDPLKKQNASSIFSFVFRIETRLECAAAQLAEILHYLHQFSSINPSYCNSTTNSRDCIQKGLRVLDFWKSRISELLHIHHVFLKPQKTEVHSFCRSKNS